MKSELFYYTGSGNSLWAARILAEKLGDAGMVPISRIEGKPRVDAG